MNIKLLDKMTITKKLFIITAVVFALFIGGTLIIQSLFFEKFYVYKKKNDLISVVDKFKVEYNKTDSYQKAVDLMDEYEANYNIRIIVLGKPNIVKFSARPAYGRSDTGRTRELIDFVQLWVQSSANVENLNEKNKTITILPQIRDNTASSLVAISANNQKNETIFALTSLQPVNEAVSVIEKLYLYFCIGAVFITILLALVYSNMIAKPLVRINKVATKMASLDFSEKCEVSSKDEISNVASSLNFLSENLDRALNSLKQANAKLEEDIEKERKLEKMRREFVAAVSHELKTPITLIDGYAVGLKDDIFEGEEKEYYLDIIIDEAEKMGNLVSDMLDLSHLESGNFKLKREEFNITELIQFTLKKYEALIAEKKVDMQMNFLDNVRVFADWTRLEQVLTNFITNALRHVEEKGSIFVRMLEAEDKVTIEVENTGSSIPEEDIEKIWDKFYKVDKSRNRKLGGTGIGLSIVKNILTLHGYDFGAENTEHGVKFYFSVPNNNK